MAKTHLIILTVLGAVLFSLPISAASFEEIELQNKITALEKRYKTYQRKYSKLKKRADEIDAQVANLPSIVQGRLTPTTGVPITVAATTGNGTVYFTPYKGNYVSVYYRNAWRLMRFAEISLALSGTANNTLYDIFIYRGNLGTVALELSAAWANSFNRTDTLTTLDGVYVKNSDNTRRYLGTIRTSGGANLYNDTEIFRGIWNYYNRTPRILRWFDASNTWTYGTTVWRQAGADAANDVSYVIGIQEVLVHGRVKTNTVSSNNTAKDFTVGIGVNTTTTNLASLMGADGQAANQTVLQVWSEYAGYPAAGFNTNSWLEFGVSGNNVDNWGDNGAANVTRSGMITVIEG